MSEPAARGKVEIAAPRGLSGWVCLALQRRRGGWGRETPLG